MIREKHDEFKGLEKALIIHNASECVIAEQVLKKLIIGSDTDKKYSKYYERAIRKYKWNKKDIPDKINYILLRVLISFFIICLILSIFQK